MPPPAAGWCLCRAATDETTDIYGQCAGADSTAKATVVLSARTKPPDESFSYHALEEELPQLRHLRVDDGDERGEAEGLSAGAGRAGAGAVRARRGALRAVSESIMYCSTYI